MSVGVMTAVLLAALVHAGWNVLIKGAADKLAMTLAVAIGAAVVALVLLPVLPMPARPSWPYIAASVGLQSVYYLLIARAYRLIDISLAYPLMRGLAPFIVALIGVACLGEVLSGGEWLAVGCVCLGVLAFAISAPARRASAPGMVAALANAVVIAGYTLIDGAGVRLSGSPAGYTLTLSVLTGLVTVAMAIAGGNRPRLTPGILGLGLVGGVATALSYGVALWAMTRAPVAPVAALRETAIVFALILSRIFVGEQVGRQRIAAVALVLAGVVALRLG